MGEKTGHHTSAEPSIVLCCMNMPWAEPVPQIAGETKHKLRVAYTVRRGRFVHVQRCAVARNAGSGTAICPTTGSAVKLVF